MGRKQSDVGVHSAPSPAEPRSGISRNRTSLCSSRRLKANGRDSCAIENSISTRAAVSVRSHSVQTRIGCPAEP